MRSWRLAAGLAAALAAAPASARPFDVDDLLKVESFGQAAIAPGGRWLVFEQRDPYDTAPRFDYLDASVALTRLRRVDLQHAGPARDAFAIDPGPGVTLGAFSPDGGRLAVYRLQGEAWTLGVLELATGQVRWLALTPQERWNGQTLAWLSATTFVVVARRDGAAPLGLRRGYLLAERLPRLWAAAARGDGAHEVLGSGRYADLRRRAPPNDLLRVDAVSGRATVLATGAFTDLELSPDGRRLALFETGADLQPRADGPVRGPRGLETEASHLVLVDLRTGAVSRPAADRDLLTQLLSWSPSGDQLLVMARGPDGLWSSGALLAVTPATGGLRPLGEGVAPQLDLNPPKLWTAWMGETPLVFGRRPGAGRDDWFALGAHPINLTAAIPTPPEGRLRQADVRRLTVVTADAVWTVDRTGRIVRRQPGGVRPALPPPSTANGYRRDRAPEAPSLAVGASGGVSTLWRLAPGGRPGRPGPEVGDAAVRAAQDGVAVVQAEDARGVGRLELRRAQTPPRIIATVNARLAATDAMTVHPVRHTDLDGRAVTSWLFLPAGARRAPLVVRAYLGGAFATPPVDPPGELSFMLNLRLLTGHGYAVLVPSLPKPADGQAEPMAQAAARILRAVDAAAADPALAPRFDPARLALVGYSFGGFTTMAALTQTDRFRAGVALSGISDFTAMWGVISPFSAVEPEVGYTSNWRAGAVESTQTRFGRPPWDAPERYRRNSPIYFADRITTPLLLAHGGQDGIPITQSEAMYSALFRQGKDAQFITYFGENHVFTSPGDIRDLYARIFAFLDEHLAVD